MFMFGIHFSVDWVLAHTQQQWHVNRNGIVQIVKLIDKIWKWLMNFGRHSFFSIYIFLLFEFSLRQPFDFSKWQTNFKGSYDLQTDNRLHWIKLCVRRKTRYQHHGTRHEGWKVILCKTSHSKEKQKSRPKHQGTYKNWKTFFAPPNFDGVYFHLTVSFIFQYERHVWRFIVCVCVCVLLTLSVVLNLVKQSNFVRKEKEPTKGWRPARR